MQLPVDLEVESTGLRFPSAARGKTPGRTSPL
jgi:hypothetical protein